MRRKDRLAAALFVMQQHTGEHIVSGITHRLFHLDNVGFHMGARPLRSILMGSSLRSRWPRWNVWPTSNLRKSAGPGGMPAQREAGADRYRSKKELTGEVRIVTVPGYDCCACCGLHTAHTGEVGAIKVLSVQRYKGGVRVTLQFGSRAIQDFDEKLKSVTAISVLLSARPEEVVDAVERLLAERDGLRQQVYQLQQEIFTQKAAAVPEGHERVASSKRDCPRTACAIFAWPLRSALGWRRCSLEAMQKAGNMPLQARRTSGRWEKRSTRRLLAAAVERPRWSKGRCRGRARRSNRLFCIRRFDQ